MAKGMSIRKRHPPRKRIAGTAGRTIRGGYVVVMAHGHPRADINGYVLEHILVAERALGRYLPAQAVVHHVNESKQENRGGNLVVCENDGYHRTLHRRMRALAACGNANWRKCAHCKEHDDPAKMVRVKTRSPDAPIYQHRECLNAAIRAVKARRRARLKAQGLTSNGTVPVGRYGPMPGRRKVQK